MPDRPTSLRRSPLALAVLAGLALALQAGPGIASPGSGGGGDSYDDAATRQGPSTTTGDPKRSETGETKDGSDSGPKEKDPTQTPSRGDDRKAADEPNWPKTEEAPKQGGGQGEGGSKGDGSGGSDGSGDSEGAEAPESDKTFKVEPAQGDVKVKRKHESGFSPFTGAGTLPFGSTVDAGKGFAKLVAATGTPGATQSATFFEGVFKVMQSHATSVPYTVLSLVGGDFSACGPAAAGVRSAGSRKRAIRRLWGRGKGKFLTRGRYSSASVRGTTWLTEDRCDGTLTRVKRGIVRVCDFGKRRYVSVRAGHSYLSKRRGATLAPPLGERLCRARS